MVLPPSRHLLYSRFAYIRQASVTGRAADVHDAHNEAAKERAMSCSYPAGIIREDDGSGYSVYFPDLPNVAAGGESVEEALNNASSGLAVALRDLAERNVPVPVPSSMEEARAKVRAEREADELPFPDDALFQNVDAQAFS